VNCAKMDELIEMRFSIWMRVGPRNHVLGGVHSLKHDVILTEQVQNLPSNFVVIATFHIMNV